jgi:hypothetical protein
VWLKLTVYECCGQTDADDEAEAERGLLTSSLGKLACVMISVSLLRSRKRNGEVSNVSQLITEGKGVVVTVREKVVVAIEEEAGMRIPEQQRQEPLKHPTGGSVRDLHIFSREASTVGMTVKATIPR